jgi:hypothetical protein
MAMQVATSKDKLAIWRWQAHYMHDATGGLF